MFLAADTISRLPINSVISQELGQLLRVRQRRLVNFQYFSSSISAKALVPMADEVNHVTCLQVALGNMQDFQTARILVDRMTSVTRLTITMNSHRHTMDGLLSDACGEVVNTMFASGNAFSRGHKLKRLRLENMWLQEIGITLPKVLPFDGLTHLQLYNCSQTNILCETLSQLDLDLQSFCAEHIKDPPRPGAIDGFLRSLPPLRQLRITHHDRIRLNEKEVESFDWTALMVHAPNLRCLDLDDFTAKSELFIDTTRNLPDFLAFCKSASDLQQLSIIGPELSKAAWSTPYGLHTLLVGFGDSSRHKGTCINRRAVLSEESSKPTILENLRQSRIHGSRISQRQSAAR